MIINILRSCFRYNRLASGSVPKSLSNCVQLEEFNIENNAVRNVKLVKQMNHFAIEEHYTLVYVMLVFRCAPCPKDF